VKAALPAASRIATLVNIKNPAQKHHMEDIPQMSKALHFDSILVHATKEEELEAAFQDAVKAKAHALVVGSLGPVQWTSQTSHRASVQIQDAELYRLSRLGPGRGACQLQFPVD
jgi:hypothetical protein